MPPPRTLDEKIDFAVDCLEERIKEIRTLQENPLGLSDAFVRSSLEGQLKWAERNLVWLRDDAEEVRTDYIKKPNWLKKLLK